jgi:hypothetical protein
LPTYLPVAQIIKRHTFNEPKWKCLCLSGQFSDWIIQLKEFLVRRNAEEFFIACQVERAKGTKGSEFYLLLEDTSIELNSHDLLCAPRESFPPLGKGEFYLCDLVGQTVQSDRGDFVLRSYFENSSALHAVSSVSLLLESKADKNFTLEVPAKFLIQKESSLWIEDIGVWILGDDKEN